MTQEGEAVVMEHKLQADQFSTEADDVSRNRIDDEIDEDQVIKLLGEVVGGYKLTRDYANSEDEVDEDIKPYCIVKFGDKIVHRTKKAEGGRNPVWTVSTGSLFVLEVTPRNLAQHDLHVSVWAKRPDPLDPLKLNVLEKSCFWGKVDIDLSKVILSHCNEQRLELDLQVGDVDTGLGYRGSLTLRFRLATSSDERFLALLHNKPELLKQRSTRTLAETPSPSDEDENCAS